MGDRDIKVSKSRGRVILSPQLFSQIVRSIRDDSPVRKKKCSQCKSTDVDPETGLCNKCLYINL
jgi:hypothetical protein